MKTMKQSKHDPFMAFVERLAIKNRAGLVMKEMAETFQRTRVARSAAALSYNLTISIFPFLICVSAILGSLNIRESDLHSFLAEVFPVEAIASVIEFLTNLTGNRSELMLFVGVTAMITSSSATFRCFTGIMGDIQGEMRYTGIRRGIFSFVFSIAFLAAIYFSGLAVLTGEWLLQILERYFGFGSMFTLWTRIRFPLLFLLIFGIIFGVYIISAPRVIRKRSRLPGAFTAAVALVVTSIIYSRMINASIRYAILYGSLASVIILMIWLYTCGIILIMGNVLNISLYNSKNKDTQSNE